MNPRTLALLAVILGLGNPVTAIIVTVEHVPDSAPIILALFSVPWLLGAALLRRGRLTAGAVVVGLLATLNVVSFAGWKRTSALDWANQSIGAGLAAVCLIGAVSVLVRRFGQGAPVGVTR